MTEDELDRLADKIAARLRPTATQVHINGTGNYTGTKADLAKSVTTAIRDAFRRGQLPRNIITDL